MSCFIEELTKDATVVGEDFFSLPQKKTKEKEVFIAGPISEADICKAETDLCIIFPAEYRNFLAKYGSLMASGTELYGLTPYDIGSDSLFINVVFENNLRRKHAQLAEHEKYIVISTDGMGADFMIDTSDPSKTRVFARGPGIDDIFVANGLDDFVKGHLEDTFARKLNEATGL